MWLVYDYKEHGVDLEVEGLRYYRDASLPDAYVLGPPPSMGGDLELEGAVNACHVEYIHEHIRVPRLLRARYRVMASWR